MTDQRVTVAASRAVNQLAADLGKRTNGTAPPPVPQAADTCRKYHRLGRPEQRRLEDWLQSIWSNIEAERPETVAIAADASKALGFDVRKGNVRAAVKAIGKRLPSPKVGACRAAATRKRQARPLFDLLNRIAVDLGYDRPEDFLSELDRLGIPR